MVKLVLKKRPNDVADEWSQWEGSFEEMQSSHADLGLEGRCEETALVAKDSVMIGFLTTSYYPIG